MKKEKSIRKVFLLIYLVLVCLMFFFSSNINGVIDTLKMPSLIFCFLLIGFEIYKIFFSSAANQEKSMFVKDKKIVLLLLLLIVVGGIKTGFDFFQYYKENGLVEYRSVFRMLFSLGLFITLAITYISTLVHHPKPQNVGKN